jgi:hypothetical protein
MVGKDLAITRRERKKKVRATGSNAPDATHFHNDNDVDDCTSVHDSRV